MPTGFLPIEDQGYLLATVQLPDGASLERTNAALQKAAEIARKVPGVENTLSHRGHLRARQQRDPRQFRRRLHHPERLELARQGRGSAAAVHQALS
jgi:multidrug efflux pump subunit AcrB